MMKKSLFATLALLVGTLSAFAKDFNVEDLPFYKIGQVEKEKMYIDVAEAFVNSENSLLATQYLIDSSPAEVAEFTKAYRKFHADRTGEVLRDLIIFGYKGNQFAHVTMEAGAGVQSVAQLVWEQEMDKPKVDWRATYGYSETTWEEFIETKPQVPTLMRVRLAPANYYNYQFRDDKEYICLKCFHPFLQKELFAYIKKGDEKFEELNETIESRGHSDVTVELCYPEVIKDWKQVEVVRVLHNTWYGKDYYSAD